MNIEKFTQKAQQAIMDSQDVAVRMGHQQLDGEHLHASLLSQQDGLIPKLVQMAASRRCRAATACTPRAGSINS
jgi:ATP-dependent Clp protease ATP-binding subunit ClpA